MILKKKELDFSYWLTLQNRVLNHGFVTVTTNPGNGKQFWQPTPRGIKAYKTILDLTKRKRLFNGPRFNEKQIVEFKEKETHSYITTKNWLIAKDFIRPIFDKDTNSDRYELTEYAYEFFQTYSDTITKCSVYPGPHILRRFAKTALMSIVFLCFVIIRAITDRHRKKNKYT